MARHPRSADEAIARFDEWRWRVERTEAAREARRRDVARSAASIGRRVANVGMAIVALIVATIAFGLIVGPIGITGLFVVMALMVLALIAFSMWPAGDRAPVEYKEDLPNKAVVQRLDSFLVRRRPALPPPAAREADAISARLPLLEKRLEEVNPLDPLAQDARRLMGRHLPELIERYQRVPHEYRSERDGEGLTVDQRLTQGITAVREALDDLGRKLASEDVDAFRTHGKFIETRYREDEGLKGE